MGNLRKSIKLTHLEIFILISILWFLIAITTFIQFTMGKYIDECCTQAYRIIFYYLATLGFIAPPIVDKLITDYRDRVQSLLERCPEFKATQHPSHIKLFNLTDLYSKAELFRWPTFAIIELLLLFLFCYLASEDIRLLPFAIIITIIWIWSIIEEAKVGV